VSQLVALPSSQFDPGNGNLGLHASVAAPLPQQWDSVRDLITSRHNVSPRRLQAPGPTAQQLEVLLSLAAAAPDHGRFTPWRFIVIPADKRPALAEVFARALVERDPGATLERIGAAREKAYRAPLLMASVVRLGGGKADVPDLERVVSMGAAIQNLLLGTQAMGFGAGLTSGQAMTSPHMATLLRLDKDEVAVCFINIGIVTQRKTGAGSRPQAVSIVSTL
jgi:nitroreductase